MAEQNIKMNVKTDTGYDTLYPQANLTNVKGTLDIKHGGTGSGTAEGARNALGLGEISTETIHHNSVFRGKNLGTSVTTEQYQSIANGTFKDLYVGDYWTINGTIYRIACFDYFLNTGDTALTKHHVVIVPDKNMYTRRMNSGDTTVGGYVGSEMYKSGLDIAKATIKKDFAGHVLSHRVFLVNAVSNGIPSNGLWANSEIELMTEQMVYGGGIFTTAPNGSKIPFNIMIEKSQLPLFAIRPDLISNRQHFWLQNIVGASHFAFVYLSGVASNNSASTAQGVRPYFLIS